MATAYRFEELICWQVAVQLRDRIFVLTEEGAAARDRNFTDNIRRSARSAPSNLAEGFGAGYPGEFARFGRIARRSLIETRNHLKEARDRQLISEQDVSELIHLTFRAQKATTRLIIYLESCKKRREGGWPFDL